MLENLIFPLIAVIGGFLGAVHDLRTREVPDWINYFMIIFGLSGYLIVSIMEWSVWPFIQSLGAAFVFYIIAALMFYSGQWGGGDAKMLIGFGALLPVYPVVLANWFSPILSFWPFFVTVFFNIVLVGAALSLLAVLYLVSKHPKEFLREMEQQVKTHKNWIFAVALVLFIPITMYFIWLELFLTSMLSWIVLGLFLLIFLAARAIEKTCMIKKVKVKKLTIGDWLAKDVMINNKLVCATNRTGLTEKDLTKLKILAEQGKLKNVQIRSGIPFIPSFFLGLTVALVFGDLILIIISQTL